LDHTNAPGGSSDFQQKLLALWQDPQVRSLALKLAGDPHLAEDVLHAAYCMAAGVKHPERIEDPRAYFIKVLKHEAYHLYALRRAVPFENPEDAMDPSQPGTILCAPARPIDETVCSSLQIEFLLGRLAAERDCFLASIPARSGDPVRYRAVIYDADVQIVCDAMNGEASDADGNAALRAAYPEYFDQPGASLDLCYQRFRRAREDVKAVLRAVVNRDELI
jgi:DNA-directed RNA polymerase specialized sigma24 family protein